MASWLRLLIIAIVTVISAEANAADITSGGEKVCSQGRSDATSDRQCRLSHQIEQQKDLVNDQALAGDLDDASMLARSMRVHKTESSVAGGAVEIDNRSAGGDSRSAEAIATLRLTTPSAIPATAISEPDLAPVPAQDEPHRIFGNSSNTYYGTALLETAKAVAEKAVRASAVLSSGTQGSPILWFVVALICGCVFTSCIVGNVDVDDIRSQRGSTFGSPTKAANGDSAIYSKWDKQANGHTKLDPKRLDPKAVYDMSERSSLAPSVQAVGKQPYTMQGASMPSSTSQPAQFHPAPMQRSPMQAPRTPEVVFPPLCPALVLHDSITRLYLPKLEIIGVQSARGHTEGHEFDIDGPIRQSLFRASICGVEGEGGVGGGVVIGVSLPWNGPNPWAIVRPLAQESEAMFQRTLPPNVATGSFTKLEIIGPDKNMYGILAAQTRGSRAFVIHRSTGIFTIEQDNSRSTLTVTLAGGETVASMEPRAGHADQLELKVEAGVCPLLILSCVLAVLIVV